MYKQNQAVYLLRLFCLVLHSLKKPSHHYQERVQTCPAAQWPGCGQARIWSPSSIWSQSRSPYNGSNSLYFLDDAFEAPNSSFEVACLACRLLSALSCYCIFSTGFHTCYVGLRLAVMLRLVLNSRPSCLHPQMLRLQGCSTIPGSLSHVRAITWHKVMKPYTRVSSVSTCSYMLVCNQFCVKSYVRQCLELMVLHMKGLIFLI